MGDYGRYEPNEKQVEATQYLLAYGLTNKFIDLNYKLVAQNQVSKPMNERQENRGADSNAILHFRLSKRRAPEPMFIVS